RPRANGPWRALRRRRNSRVRAIPENRLPPARSPHDPPAKGGACNTCTTLTFEALRSRVRVLQGEGKWSPVLHGGTVKKPMSIEIKQHLRLSQQLVMTPQLQQAIKLLQLSR